MWICFRLLTPLCCCCCFWSGPQIFGPAIVLYILQAIWTSGCPKATLPPFTHGCVRVIVITWFWSTLWTLILLVCLESVEENASLAAHVSWGRGNERRTRTSVGKRRQRQQGGVTEEQMRPGSLWGRLLAANFSHETSRSSIFGHCFKNKRGTVLSDRRTDR